MDNPLFQLSEAKSSSKGHHIRAITVIDASGYILFTLGFVLDIPLLVLIGVIVVVDNLTARRRNDHVLATAFFYSDHVTLLPYKRPGALMATRWESYTKLDVVSAKLIRERISGSADPLKSGTPTGIKFILKSRRAGTSLSLVNREPEEILQLEKFLSDIWGISLSDPGVASAKLYDLIGKEMVNITSSGMSTFKVTIYVFLLGMLTLVATMALILTILVPFGLVLLFITAIIFAPIAYLYLRDKNAYGGIKSVTIKENGLDIYFGLRNSEFYTWNSIKCLYMPPVKVNIDGVVQKNGRISFKGRHWAYHLGSELTEILIVAYENATGRSPPAKKKWI